MDYKLLHQILNEAELYEKKYNKEISSIKEFRCFLNEQAYQAEKPLDIKIESLPNEDVMLNNEICKLFIMMGRYAKISLKKGLDEFDQLINEDFTYLYRLSDYKSLTKQQLIEKNKHDKQYGTIIIKRLINHGLINEKDDIKDKRQKLIYVTKKGEDLINESFPTVSKISTVIAGDLNEIEKKQLLDLLKKLNKFHKHIYECHRNDDIDTIVELT